MREVSWSKWYHTIMAWCWSQALSLTTHCMDRWTKTVAWQSTKMHWGAFALRAISRNSMGCKDGYSRVRRNMCMVAHMNPTDYRCRSVDVYVRLLLEIQVLWWADYMEWLLPGSWSRAAVTEGLLLRGWCRASGHHLYRKGVTAGVRKPLATRTRTTQIHGRWSQNIIKHSIYSFKIPFLLGRTTLEIYVIVDDIHITHRTWSSNRTVYRTLPSFWGSPVALLLRLGITLQLHTWSRIQLLEICYDWVVSFQGTFSHVGGCQQREPRQLLGDLLSKDKRLSLRITRGKKEIIGRQLYLIR